MIIHYHHHTVISYNIIPVAESTPRGINNRFRIARFHGPLFCPVPQSAFFTLPLFTLRIALFQVRIDLTTFAFDFEPVRLLATLSLIILKQRRPDCASLFTFYVFAFYHACHYLNCHCYMLRRSLKKTILKESDIRFSTDSSHS